MTLACSNGTKKAGEIGLEMGGLRSAWLDGVSGHWVRVGWTTESSGSNAVGMAGGIPWSLRGLNAEVKRECER